MNKRKKIQFFFSGGGSPAPVGLLNTAAGAGAAAAFSLRMLNADFIGEDVVEVKRVANNDFDRFKLNANQADTAAIASFCGASDGVVSWWQSQANILIDNPAVQTAEASAPKIYDASTGIVTENGKPAIKFDVARDTFLQTGAVPALDGGLYTDFIVNSIKSTDTDGGIVRAFEFSNMDKDLSYYIIYRVNLFATNGRDTSENYEAVQLSSPPLHLQASSKNDVSADTIDLSVNGNTIGVNNDSTASPDIMQSIVIGRRNTTLPSPPSNFNGKIQEYLIYPDRRTGSRTTIDSNQIAHYGIS